VVPTLVSDALDDAYSVAAELHGHCSPCLSSKVPASAGYGQHVATAGDGPAEAAAAVIYPNRGYLTESARRTSFENLPGSIPVRLR
jgi:hypothetical protein